VREFAALFTALDQTTSTNAKVAALAEYFATAPEPDRIWTIALLSGRRPKRTVTTARLREWAAQLAGIPLWLFEEAYPVVGDLAETIALVLPEPTCPASDARGLAGWIDTLRDLAQVDEPERKATVLSAWATLGPVERFVFNKLITGGFRMGVSQKLMTRALSRATGLDEPILAHRLMGGWSPDTTTFHALIHAPDPGADLSRPYPFSLTYQLDDAPDTLGDIADWAAEWKWDGIRGQLVIRGGTHFTWSRGEELITDRFPEFAPLGDALPKGTVLDGEIVAWATAEAVAAPAQARLPLDDQPPGAVPADAPAPIPGLPGAPLPFAQLQRRIGRKTVPKKLLAQAPARFLAYDLLEHGGEDIRTWPYSARRAALDALLAALPPTLPLSASPIVTAPDWPALAATRTQARTIRAEGLMLKRRDAPYREGRRKGDWWKWKLDPLTIDAVMIYAQSGHGRRANLFTDFTFAVPDRTGELVPFTKAYSGLTDKEFRDITAWVKKNTLHRFGPVRQVTPALVFEIAFEGIQRSPRHKSGIALRFPRMARWRQDKPLAEVDTLSDLEALLATYGG
jgi:DNA ligase-1